MRGEVERVLATFADHVYVRQNILLCKLSLDELNILDEVERVFATLADLVCT